MAAASYDRDPRVDEYIDALPAGSRRSASNVFLYDGGIVPEPRGRSSPGNKTARMVAIYEGEQVNATALRTMFEQIIANNRAGGWRRLKRDP
jgi:hypothetical protein